MKKTLLFAAAVLALAACSKESPVKEEGAIDASKIVFDIKVENADATKAVKIEWEDGDVVYAFFEDNTTQYVKMTYNGSSWTYKDKDGGATFTDLTLAESGKKVTSEIMTSPSSSTSARFMVSASYSPPSNMSTSIVTSLMPTCPSASTSPNL